MFIQPDVGRSELAQDQPCRQQDESLLRKDQTIQYWAAKARGNGAQ